MNRPNKHSLGIVETSLSHFIVKAADTYRDQSTGTLFLIEEGGLGQIMEVSLPFIDRLGLEIGNSEFQVDHSRN